MKHKKKFLIQFISLKVTIALTKEILLKVLRLIVLYLISLGQLKI